MYKRQTEYISLGEDYHKVKKIYSINIFYFDIGRGEDYLYHGQNHFIGVHTKDQLVVNTKERSVIVSKLSPEIFPEYILIRTNKFDKIAVTSLEEWMDYLKRGTIRPDTMTPGLGEAREKLRYYSMPPEDRYAYDEHLNAVMIQNDVLDGAKLEGRMEGMEKGIEKGRMDIARNLKSMGLDIAAIQKATGLLPEEIQKL